MCRTDTMVESPIEYHWGPLNNSFSGIARWQLLSCNKLQIIKRSQYCGQFVILFGCPTLFETLAMFRVSLAFCVLCHQSKTQKIENARTWPIQYGSDTLILNNFSENNNLRKIPFCRILYYFCWVSSSRGFWWSGGCKVSVLIQKKKCHCWGAAMMMVVSCGAQWGSSDGSHSKGNCLISPVLWPRLGHCSWKYNFSQPGSPALPTIPF